MKVDSGDKIKEGRMRLDRWLWFARFFKSRNSARQICNARKVRLGGYPVMKASQNIKVGDVLTFPQGRQIRTIEILSLAARRGRASEAQALYSDLAPPLCLKGRSTERMHLISGWRDPGSGRPTKIERRAINRLRGNP